MKNKHQNLNINPEADGKPVQGGQGWCDVISFLAGCQVGSIILH